MKKHAHSVPKQKLHMERLQHHWSQQELAEKVGTSVVTINRWERGVTDPSPYFRLKLCALFGKSATELGLLPGETAFSPLPSPQHPSVDAAPPLPSSTPVASSLWHLPFRRNTLFTGREAILTHLHTLFSIKRTLVLALSGLGGIGKTQTALEYAYRFRHEYHTVIWLNAESHTTLVADCRSLLRRLHLLQQDEQQQEHSFEVFKDWLSLQQSWLLLLDNVEQSAQVEQILPSFLTGHVLLTTRAQAIGPLAQKVDLMQMTADESTLFLLRRAKLLPPDACLQDASRSMVDTALIISQLLDGLPLALDQAGAYIEETGCSLSDYQERYRHYRKTLLDRRGENTPEHPASVVATLSLCMEQVEHRHPAAAELLRCCAFLHPDAIDEDLLRVGAPALGPVLADIVTSPLALDAALASLRTLSLLYRNTTTRRFIIHRLVQAVIKDSMEEELQRLWAIRLIQAINLAFPNGESPDELHQCEQYLLQASLCTELISQWTLTSLEAGQLLFKVGRYLMLRSDYARAEELLKNALVIQQNLNVSSLETAATLNILGSVYEAQGNYPEAESAYQQALMLRENKLSPGHPDVVETLGNLGRLALVLGRYAQAQLLLNRVLLLKQERLGSTHPHLIPILYLVSSLYQQQGKYAESEGFLQQALIICQQSFGETHPHTIESLSRLITLYMAQGNERQARALHQHTMTLFAQAGDHMPSQTVPSLRSLGALHALQGDFRQAEVLLRQASAICRRTFGNTHPETAESLSALGEVYNLQGKYAEAEDLLRQTLAIQEHTLGASHLDIARTLHHIATLLLEQGHDEQAWVSAQRALEIRQRVLEVEHPDVGESLQLLTHLHQKKTLQ